MSKYNSPTKQFASKCGLLFACSASGLLGFGNTWWSKTHIIVNYAWICFGLAVVCQLLTLPKKIIPSKSYLGFLAIFLLFTWFYWKGHNPPMTQDGHSMVQSQWWWNNLISMSLLAALLGIISSSVKSAFWIVGSFCFAATGLALYFAIATLFLEDYNRGFAVYNVLENAFINRAGIMNLMVLFPTFVAFVFNSRMRSSLIVNETQTIDWKVLFSSRSIVYFILISFAYGIVTFCAVLHHSRMVLVVLLVIVPLIIGAGIVTGKKSEFKLRKKRFYVFGVLIIMVFVILSVVNFFSARPVGFDLLIDSRFTLYLYDFLVQIINSPFDNARPSPNLPFPWYHNFYADIHRSSGFFALMLSVGLSIWIILRSLNLSRLDQYGKTFFALLLIVFCVLNTSVVPEGEFQPYLLFLMIGSVVEACLKQERSSDFDKMSEINKFV